MQHRPSEAELEILQVLWEQQPRTVKEVHEAVSAIRDVGYTTTLKQMQRMLDKGILRREAGDGKSHIYYAVVAREEMQSTLFDRMVNHVFDASISQVVMHALGKGKATKKELEEIRRFMDKLEKPEDQ